MTIQLSNLLPHLDREIDFALMTSLTLSKASKGGVYFSLCCLNIWNFLALLISHPYKQVISYNQTFVGNFGIKNIWMLCSVRYRLDFDGGSL